MRLRQPILSSALAVFVFSVAVYANTLGHGFVWDDYTLIVDNEAVRTMDVHTLAQVFSEPFVRVHGLGNAYYRPLTALSYHLDYKLFGGAAAGFHLTNVVANAAVCTMAFGFLYLLFGDCLLALIAALLFAAHPVHTEAVAWISGRTDVFAALWSLVSLSCYLLARRGHRAWFAPAVAAFALALFSKESAAGLPVLIALLEWGPFGSADSNRRSRSSRTTTTAVFLVTLAIYLAVRHAVTGSMTSDHPHLAEGLAARAALPFSIFAGYVFKALAPFDLNAEYDAPVPHSLADLHAIAGLALVVLVAWSLWRFRKRPEVILGLSVFIVGLAPVLNVIPLGEVSAERFLYLPSLGATLVIAHVFVLLLRRGAASENPRGLHAKRILLLPALVIAVCAAKTVQRNFDWANDDVLFAKTVLQAPDSPRAYGSLALAAERRGDVATAERGYRRALELQPDYAVALVNLAEIYFRQARYEEALPLISRAVDNDPNDARLRSNLGMLYTRTGRFEEASGQFEKVLSLDPASLSAHFGLGYSLYQTGDLGAARPHFIRAAGAAGYSAAEYYLAEIEYAAGNYDLARAHARRFIARSDREDDRRERAESILRDGE